MRTSLLRAGLALLAVLGIGLSACLTGDAPKLSAGDLTMPRNFAGAYFATRFPANPAEGPDTIQATVEPTADRSFLLTFIEKDRKDSPVRVQLIDLRPDILIAVMTEPGSSPDAMLGLVTPASDGAWVFRTVELKADARDRILKEALMRHGATDVRFDQSELQHDEFHGQLSAANLRMLFSDHDFLKAIDTEKGFRLSPAP